MLAANVRLLAEKERLELERQRLLELDRMKTEFLARVSHDLRTPLNSIIGFSDLLQTGAGGKLNGKQLEMVDRISRNGRTLLDLINDLLDLSTFDAGHGAIRRQPIALTEILTDLRAATEPVLDTARLKAVWPTPDALDGKVAWVDRRRILQVLMNLVDNARKFTPATGTVTVTMDADALGARFSVHDDGPGVPPDEQDRIFRPFYRRAWANANTGGDAGIGLGLAIVKGLVGLHHGTITLDSDIGKGCRFLVTIPVPGPAEQP